MTDHPQNPPHEIPGKVLVTQETGIPEKTETPEVTLVTETPEVTLVTEIPEETETPEVTLVTEAPEVISEVQEIEDPKITTRHKKI